MPKIGNMSAHWLEREVEIHANPPFSMLLRPGKPHLTRSFCAKSARSPSPRPSPSGRGRMAAPSQRNSEAQTSSPDPRRWGVCLFISVNRISCPTSALERRAGCASFSDWRPSGLAAGGRGPWHWFGGAHRSAGWPFAGLGAPAGFLPASLPAAPGQKMVRALLATTRRVFSGPFCSLKVSPFGAIRNPQGATTPACSNRLD